MSVIGSTESGGDGLEPGVLSHQYTLCFMAGATVCSYFHLLWLWLLNLICLKVLFKRAKPFLIATCWSV